MSTNVNVCDLRVGMIFPGHREIVAVDRNERRNTVRSAIVFRAGGQTTLHWPTIMYQTNGHHRHPCQDSPASVTIIKEA